MKEKGERKKEKVRKAKRFLSSFFAFCLLPFVLLKTSRPIAPLLAVIFALYAMAPVFAQQDSGSGEKSAGISFSYVFENPRFHVPLIEIDLTADGSGELRFKRGESDDILDRKIKLLPETLARIRQLMEDSQFLASEEDYQHKKDFSHLGWMTILARQGERERRVRFNYTEHLQVQEMSAIFRAIATQEMHLFDIDLSQQFQPLDLPRQIEILENDLRLARIAEPERLLEPLREIADNDVLPLIARNRAKRLIESIEKKKYKSPVKAK